MVLTREVENQIQLLLSENRKMEAIKLVYDSTKCSLKEAKDLVDNFRSGQAGAARSPVSAITINSQLMSLISQGKKLEAIKLYKDSTGLGLAESKDYVDNLSARNTPPVSETSLQKRETQIDKILQQQGLDTTSRSVITTSSGSNHRRLIFLILIVLIAIALLYRMFSPQFIK